MSPSESKTTTHHDEIRRWAEDHAGKPASVKGTEDGGEAGVLRYQEQKASGEDSTFFKLVRR